MRTLPRRPPTAAVLSFVLFLLLAGCTDDGTLYEPELEGLPVGLGPERSITMGATTYLGSLGGGWSSAEGLNDAGHVVGATGRVDGAGTSAFLWTPTFGMIGLGTLGGSSSEATAINDHGQVVGYSSLTGGAHHAVRWIPGWGVQDLGTLGGSMSYAFATNNAGQVVGTSLTEGGAESHAFVWTPGQGMVDIGPSGFWSEATGISDGPGYVVGTLSTVSSIVSFITRAGGTGLDVFAGLVPGGHTMAFDVNSSGQVVGRAIGEDENWHAFLWTYESGMVDLGLPDGCTSSVAYGINEAGVVVGELDCALPFNLMFIWTAEGGMHDMGYGSAREVNDALQIAGTEPAGAVLRSYIPNRAPVANAGGPYAGMALSALGLAGSGTTDPEADPLTYHWDFGDGTTSSDMNPSKTWANHGSYQVELTVTDDSDASSTVSTTATIANAIPSATFVLPATVVYEGQVFRLRLANPIDSPIDMAGLRRAFDCGGGAYSAYKTAVSLECSAIVDQALVVVRGRIRDPQGASRSYLAELDVRNRAPVPVIIGSSANPTAGSSMTLDWSFSDAGVLDAPWITIVTWGDGTRTRGPTDAQGARQTAHTYALPGSYNVTVRVTDKDGGTRITAAHVVNVAAP